VSESKPDFDDLSGAYEELLEDPLRDRFTGGAAEFFHVRKRDLIRDFFRRRRVDTRTLSLLDLGCGKGELLTLLREDFGRVSGCDPSPGMLEAGGLSAKGMETRVQHDPRRLPFDDAGFDFVTAVCVYHHVSPGLRPGLTAEVRRVLRPGGWFAVIEHNPYNPVTRVVVGRSPVDGNAILLRPSETRRLLRRGGFRIDAQWYFLYCPERLYGKLGRLESALRGIPLGGQYAIFALAQ
jgi:SAM-dependent methyltransferase